ncbi:MAG: hypothetical protein IKY16_06780 [Bacteroidales bacterium]|nr:hypothetical protein [Bacteroidales bacterium]
MNNKRRDLLKQAELFLEKAKALVERAAEEEQDCIDNLPENLQDSERCEKMESAVYCLENATGDIDEAIENITKAAA